MSITVRHVSRRFGHFTALNDVSLTVPDGKLVALLGPSGSGKTTLLRIVGGLEQPDQGTVLLAEQDVTHHPARDRQVGFVFQHYALFRHMTVFENVAFGLRVRQWPQAQVKQSVHDLLALVRLEELAQRYPHELSGGQRQRIALARALAIRPKTLLLDEPFGALDAKVRQELRAWLRQLHEQMPVTTLFVTHDQEEAFEVADQVVVMHAGRIEQVGTPQEVFEHPASPFIMDFLGQVNMFHCRVQSGVAQVGPFEVACPQHPHHWASAATAFARPDEIEVERVSRGRGQMRGRVAQVNPTGPLVKARLIAEDGGFEVNVALARERAHTLALQVGETVYLSLKQVRVFVELEYQI